MKVCSRRLVPTAALPALLVGVGKTLFNGGYRLGDFVPSGSSISKEQRFDFLDENLTKAEAQLEFISAFTEAQQADSVLQDFGILPLVLKDNAVLCMRHQKDEIGHSDRTNPLIGMLHEVIDNVNFQLTRQVRNGIPLLFLTSDASGCELKNYHDVLKFPRMFWSQPSQKHNGADWCMIVSIPTYHRWNSVKDPLFLLKDGWKHRFDELNKKYPWENKTNIAFWRGTTTYDLPYHGVELSKTPRGRLVQQSLQHPQLVDAGFVQLIQQYENDSSIQVINETEWRHQRKSLGRVRSLSALNASLVVVHPNQTRVVDFVETTAQQKYKAILDIDGNNWSSRFPELLCMNSVVIKINPDYVEYFHYNQMVKPMIHYVPASLENLTRVVQYVIAAENDEQMRRIVGTANGWCHENMNHKLLAKDLSVQIRKFHNMLGLSGAVVNLTDMVEC